MFFCLGSGLLASGCFGGPKEAADPHAILRQDLEPAGVEGSGRPGPEPDARPAAAPAKQAPNPDDAPATRAECDAAARHIEELGVDIAIDSERDPAKREKLRARKKAMLATPDAERHVQRIAARCIERETTRGEARCIARVQSPEDIDRCEGGGH